MSEDRIETPKIHQPNCTRIAPKHWVILAVILAVALAIRFTGIERMSVFMDEVWVVELAMGRGQVHDFLPADTLVKESTPPTRLEYAGPALDIFKQVRLITHPPGYVFLLRLWCNLFGTTDLATRALSAVASAFAVVVLFDIARRLYGTRAGIWSALIMALAGPQVELAQEVRPYSLLTFFSLICADIILILAHTRPTASTQEVAQRPSRWYLLPILTVMIFVTMVTHYFALGVMLGLGMFTLFFLRGRARWMVLSCFAVAAIVFAITWLPFMLDQRETVRLTADNWLMEGPEGHLGRTLSRFSDVAYRLLIPQEITFRDLIRRKLSVALIIAPFLFLHRRRDLAFLCCWLLGTLGLLTGLDLIRHTRHLELTRYTSIAAPALYILPAALTLNFGSRLIRTLVPGLVALSCACALPALSDLIKQRFREGAAHLDKHMKPGEVVVIFNFPQEPNYARITWLSLAHYSKTYPWPFVLVEGGWNDRIKAQLKDVPGIWVVAPPGRFPPESIVPGASPEHLDYFHRFGEIYRLPAPLDEPATQGVE